MASLSIRHLCTRRQYGEGEGEEEAERKGGGRGKSEERKKGNQKNKVSFEESNLSSCISAQLNAIPVMTMSDELDIT